jgi:hypothetical protein
MYVLRDKKTNKPLYLSYTIEGLKWATNSRGKLLYFKDAHLEKRNNKVIFVGNLQQSSDVYIAIYSRYPHKQEYLRIIEKKFYDAAHKMT